MAFCQISYRKDNLGRRKVVVESVVLKLGTVSGSSAKLIRKTVL